MIYPSPRAKVCHAGEKLEVQCNLTNSIQSVLQWTLTLVSEIGMTKHFTATVTSGQQNVRTDTYDDIVFRFRRSSKLRELPLSSTLVISPVQNSLNGTNISCTEGLIMESDTSTASIIVDIITGDNVGESNTLDDKYEA